MKYGKKWHLLQLRFEVIVQHVGERIFGRYMKSILKVLDGKYEQSGNKTLRNYKLELTLILTV